MLQRQRSQFFDRLRSCPGTPSLLPIDVLDSEDEKQESPQFPVGCHPQSGMGRGSAWSDDDAKVVSEAMAAKKSISRIAEENGWSWASVRKVVRKLKAEQPIRSYAGRPKKIDSSVLAIIHTFLSSAPPHTRGVLRPTSNLVPMPIACRLVLGLRCCAQFGASGPWVKFTSADPSLARWGDSNETFVRGATPGGFSNAALFHRIPNAPAAGPTHLINDGTGEQYLLGTYDEQEEVLTVTTKPQRLDCSNTDK